uniref:Inter-alpha-trypsin inhibitor heavy chain H3 n=1 Tax=Cynoglossus semilaevis TaxID=244447 RepID=A0A3P8UYU7_CYNSE
VNKQIFISLPLPMYIHVTSPGFKRSSKLDSHFLLFFQMVEVQSVKIACAVMSRFARTVMTSIALNKANSSQEVFFKVELPKTAFISNFSMEIEGQVYVGQVKGKEKAKQEYDKAVSSGKTAGLVKASGRKMESFSVSVNIAAKSTVTFVLTYEELLQRKLGKYEILTRVQPKSLVQDFQIVADIYEPQGISFVDATATFLSNDLLPLVKKTVSDKKAHISFSPTVEQQRNCSGCEATIIDGDFIINYDVRREAGLGEVQIVNGYFVHFFAPPDLHRVPKNVAFVIDRSGSMSGTKMKQTRDAMVAILKDLHEEDHFALILFDDNIKTWKNHLTKATKNNITEAIEYTQGIRDSGATDINRAVLKAVEMLKKERSQDKVPKRSTDMIVLLTDGMPNSGVSNLGKIQENVRSAVGGNMSLFCLGFGNNVDYSFLDVMSKQNKGLARRIYEASDATLQLQGFYEEVASPLLLDIDLRYPDNAVEFSTKNSFTHLFNGSEIVVAGRLHDNSVDNFLVEVSGEGVRRTNTSLGVRLEVSTDNISVFHDGKNVTLLWSDTELIKENSLNVTLRHFIKFVIVKHTKMWKRRHDQQDYLGFYTVDSHHVSKTVHGLLGQFYHEVKFEVEGLNPQEVQEKEDAFLHFKGQTIKVSRHIQKDFSKDVVNGEKVPCWFVDSSGSGLVDGQLSDYVLSGLFD